MVDFKIIIIITTGVLHYCLVSDRKIDSKGLNDLWRKSLKRMNKLKKYTRTCNSHCSKSLYKDLIFKNWQHGSCL